VRQRHVTKRFPRAYLGSFRLDDFRLIFDARGIRLVRHVVPEEIEPRLVVGFEGLAGHDRAIGAGELAVCDDFHNLEKTGAPMF